MTKRSPAYSDGLQRTVRDKVPQKGQRAAENRMPDVIPFLTYEDGAAALEWLAEVFGFTETARFLSSDGRLSP